MGKRPSAKAGTASSANKRQAVGSTLDSPLSSKVLDAEHIKKIKSEFDSTAGRPFSHCVIDGLCSEERLRAVHDELVNNLSANLKESDLFKVYQTCDLANLGRNGVLMELAERMPQLIALRDSLYSEEFKAMIQEVTGCGELGDNVDCATNLHTTGCHLLCHDDVIGTRKVSFIIYLTSPDEEWTAKDGGALEIYPSVSEGTPDIVPLKTVLPLFNTMAIFNVEAGVSFHSVQEVYTDKPRMAIQGWYHGPKDDTNKEAADKATVNQLIANGKTGATAEAGRLVLPEIETPGEGKVAPLSAADKATLRKFVNPAYLKDDASLQVREKFEQESYVLLYDFLLPDVLEELRAAAARADSKQGIGRGRLADYRSGYGPGWTPVGPPHMRRYLRFDGAPCPDDAGQDTCAPAKPPDDISGALLKRIQTDLMQTDAFARLLVRLTGMVCTSSKGETRRFRAGLDYTVATYGSMADHSRLNTVWCLVDDVGDTPAQPSSKDTAQGSSMSATTAAEAAMSAEDKLALWAEGEVGAFECYIEAEEDAVAEASDVFRMDDDDGPLLQVLARSNTLSIVLQDERVMRFVKYVGGSAPSSRWDVAVDFEIKQEEAEEAGTEDDL